MNWVPVEAGDTVGSVGYASGEMFYYTYLGTAQDDLKDDLKWVAPMYSDDESDESDHEWTYEKYVAQQRGEAPVAQTAGGDVDFME